MQEFILAMLETERLSSAILLIVIVGFGFFFVRYFWPWFTGGVESTINGWLELKREELRIEADRNERFANAWQENTKTLNKQHETLVRQGETLSSMQRTNVAIINTFLGFVDDKKVQGKLADVLYEKYQDEN